MLGKPVGIVGSALLCSKLGIGQLPANSRMIHMAGLGLLAGIGFTMSVFIAMLSFTNRIFIEEAKLSILITSLIAGVSGYVVLKYASRHDNVKSGGQAPLD